MIYKLSISVVSFQYFILVKGGEIVPPMKHGGWPASTYPTRMNSRGFVIWHFMNGETRLGVRLAGEDYPCLWNSPEASSCSLGKEPVGVFGSYAVTRALKRSIVELMVAWYGSNPPLEVEIRFKTCDLRAGSSLAELFLWCGSGGAPSIPRLVTNTP